MRLRSACRLSALVLHSLLLLSVGAFKLVKAKTIVPGDRMAVLKAEGDTSAVFKVIEVTQADKVKAAGLYVPAIGKGYLIADGVVTPR